MLFRARSQILLVATVATVASSCGPESSTSAGDDSPGSRIVAELEGYELTETHDRRLSTVYTFEREGAVLRVEVIENIGTDAAKRLTADGRLGLEALFAGALSPYPGDVTSRIVPDEKYRPAIFRETVDGIERTGYLLWANERLGFGAATREAIRYRTVVGWFHCPSTERFCKVRCFLPLEVSDAEARRVFRTLRCP